MGLRGGVAGLANAAADDAASTTAALLSDNGGRMQRQHKSQVSVRRESKRKRLAMPEEGEGCDACMSAAEAGEMSCM